MATRAPRFARNYLGDEVYFRGLAGLGPDASKRPETGWTLVTAKGPKKVTTMSQLEQLAAAMWTETANREDGKREGRATWTNTRTGEVFDVLYKKDMVQTIGYREMGRRCPLCFHADLYVEKIYDRGVCIRTYQHCSCEEEEYESHGSSCGCGSCLCKAAERSWRV